MEAFQDNEKARKRYKYLSHIPLNSDIKFVDIDLSAYLSFEALNAFDEEVLLEAEQCR